jgi:hypothetical protein
MRDGGAIQRHGDQRLLGLLDTLADGIGHFAGLAHADSNLTLAVTDHDQAAEREPATTLYDFGDAIDLNDAFLELGTTILIVAAPA